MSLPTTKEEKQSSSELALFLKDAKILVIIGMGNELRGDDAVGIEVARILKKISKKNLHVFEGYTMPEAFISPACREKPTHVLIIDAAELKEKPGRWRILQREELNEGLFTTHSIPATEMANQLEQKSNAKVAFIGIQPKSRDVGISLSKECSKAAQEIAKSILSMMK